MLCRSNNSRVPSPTPWRISDLATGSKTQRAAFVDGSLDADRQRRLEKLPGWTWTARANRWDINYKLLSRYVEEHGDAQVPQSYQVNGHKLGVWIGEQRGAFANGSLDADRQQGLQDLPGWSWNTRAEKWDSGYERLLAYVNEHDDARVPVAYEVDGYRLGHLQRVLLPNLFTK